MQSGAGRTKRWHLVYAPETPRGVDPLMGWTSSDDTQSQVRLRFQTCEQAQDYARELGLEFEVIQPQSRAHNVRSRGYGENFSSDRRAPWTH